MKRRGGKERFLNGSHIFLSAHELKLAVNEKITAGLSFGEGCTEVSGLTFQPELMINVLVTSRIKPL